MQHVLITGWPGCVPRCTVHARQSARCRALLPGHDDHAARNLGHCPEYASLLNVWRGFWIMNHSVHLNHRVQPSGHVSQLPHDGHHAELLRTLYSALRGPATGVSKPTRTERKANILPRCCGQPVEHTDRQELRAGVAPTCWMMTCV